MANKQNIIDVDILVKEYLKNQEEDKIREIEVLQRCINISTNDDFKKHLKNEIGELRKVLDSKELQYYTLDTIELIHEYIELLKTPTTFSFMGPKDDSYMLTTEKKRRDIEARYFKIASTYMDIVVESNYPIIIKCENCNNHLIDKNETNILICSECHTEIDLINKQDNTTYADTSRINVATRFVYDRKTHFRECLYNFQGKQQTTIPEQLIDKIRLKLVQYKLNDYDKDGNKTYKRVTKKNIANILKELRMGKHYDHTNLIHKMITGIELPDLSHISDKVIRDFDVLSNTYDKFFKNIDRKNFISTNYVLFQILTNNGYNCNVDDFTVLKTTERKLFHEHVLKTLFEELKWNYTSIF